MKFIHTLWQDIKKTLLNYSFLVCIIITAALCFTATVYTDMNTGRSYMVIDAIREYDTADYLKNDSFGFVNVFGCAMSGYLAMFLPILAAFPFIPNFCSERNSGLIRLTIFRTGKYRYYFSKFISALVGGGLAVMLGYLIFGLITVCIFPMPSEFPVDPFMVEAGFEPMDSLAVLRNCTNGLLGSFIYGAVSTVPAFFFASFIKNRYVITCLPFMLTYIFSTALTKYGQNLLASDAPDSWDKAIKAFSLTPSSLVGIIGSEYRNLQLICYGGFTLFSLTAYIVIMNMRTDKGE